MSPDLIAIQEGLILLLHQALDGVRVGPADDLGRNRVHVLHHADRAPGALAAAPLEATVDDRSVDRARVHFR